MPQPKRAKPPKKVSWKTLVVATDPKPRRQTEYEFSNGRKFTKPYKGT